MANKPTTQQIVVIVLIALAVIFWVFGQQWIALFMRAQGENSTSSLSTNNMNVSQTSGLIIEDITVGEGAEAIPGSILSVHYTGTLLDGTKFDSSLDRGKPFQFMLGVGQVIAGWDQGVLSMKVGGKRKLTIPANLAYGSVSGHPLQNETLVFEVELLDVRQPAQ